MPVRPTPRQLWIRSRLHRASGVSPGLQRPSHRCTIPVWCMVPMPVQGDFFGAALSHAKRSGPRRRRAGDRPAPVRNSPERHHRGPADARPGALREGGRSPLRREPAARARGLHQACRDRPAADRAEPRLLRLAHLDPDRPERAVRAGIDRMCAGARRSPHRQARGLPGAAGLNRGAEGGDGERRRALVQPSGRAVPPDHRHHRRMRLRLAGRGACARGRRPRSQPRDARTCFPRVARRATCRGQRANRRWRSRWSRSGDEPSPPEHPEGAAAPAGQASRAFRSARSGLAERLTEGQLDGQQVTT